MLKTTVNVILVLLGIVGLAYLISKYRKAQAEGRPFTWDDILSTPTAQGIGYKDGKCYQVKYNAVSGQSESTEIALSNCYNLSSFQNALKQEYLNLQAKLNQPPNNADPNDAQNRIDWQARMDEIVALLKQIKGCSGRQGFDINTMQCITA